MSYVDRLLLTLPSSAPQIADWFTRAAALTTFALPNWLPFGAIHLRLHSLCVKPQGCSAPAELHRLDGAAGVLVGSAHNLAQILRGMVLQPISKCRESRLSLLRMTPADPLGCRSILGRMKCMLVAMGPRFGKY